MILQAYRSQWLAWGRCQKFPSAVPLSLDRRKSMLICSCQPSPMKAQIRGPCRRFHIWGIVHTREVMWRMYARIQRVERFVQLVLLKNEFLETFCLFWWEFRKKSFRNIEQIVVFGLWAQSKVHRFRRTMKDETIYYPPLPTIILLAWRA